MDLLERVTGTSFSHLLPPEKTSTLGHSNTASDKHSHDSDCSHANFRHMKALTPTHPVTPPITQPPPLSARQTTMATNYYYPSQFTTPPYLSLLILAVYILAFLRHSRVFIGHCWHGNVDTTSVVNFVLYGLWTYVVAKGI